MSAVPAEAGKTKTEVLTVKMSDGREVNFAGKRKVNKSTIIDDSKIVLDGDVLQLEPGAVSVRMDFRNGETRLLPLPLALFTQFAGHGGEQKFGDELASPADKPMSEEDMVIAIDDLYTVIAGGKWGKGRAEGGGGVSGAGVVVRAIMEVTGKDQTFVKAYLQKKLDADPKLTRRALYDSFRSPNAATYAIIKRLEDEKASKTAAVDAGAELAAMSA